MKKPLLTLCLICLFLIEIQAQYKFKVANGYVVMKGQPSVVLQNTSWENNGTVDADSSRVIFTGSSNDSIKGSSGTVFYDLELNKAGGNLILDQAVGVNDTLEFVSGLLDLNGHVLTLGSDDGTLYGETESSRVTGAIGGTVQKTVSLNAPAAANPGNLGISLTSSTNMGTTLIVRGQQPQTLPNGNSISRYYEIVPTTNSSLNATLRFAYFDAELNGLGESALEAWQNEGSNWINLSPDATDTLANYVETLLDSLGTLTLGEGSLKLSLKAFLQGPYASGAMGDNLRANSLIPLTEPYTALGYSQVNGGGESISADVLNITGNDAIIDWVFLELRDKNDSSVVLKTTSALLQRDGDIVGLDGVSPVTFPGMAEDDYYLHLKHRNHLGVRSPGLMTIVRIETSHDFSSGLAQAWDKPGISSNDAMVDLGGGVYGLFRGDVNQNGTINVVDFFLSKSNATPNQAAVYDPGDINMDGNINVVDFLMSKVQSTPNKSAHQ